MKRSMSVILGALALMITVGCIWQYRKGNRDASCTKQLFAMDTVMSFTAYGPKAEEAVDAAMKEIERLDALLSTGNESSEISQLNAAGSFLISEDTLKLLEEAESIRQSTGGLFDVTVYPLMQLWGFPTGDYRVPTQEEISSTLSLVDAAQIQIEGAQVTLGSGQQVDLGGIAKGYIADRVTAFLEEKGVRSAIVDLGGNIVALGGKARSMLDTEAGETDFRIGIKDPQSEGGALLGTLPASNLTVVTSGTYERYFIADGKKYHHILDSETGYPTDTDVLSATIIAAKGRSVDCDGLSTTCLALGIENALALVNSIEGVEAILVDQDGKVHQTSEALNFAKA